MPLIMYLTKAPKYRNIKTGEYENIPRKDIELINDYFTWTMVRSEGGHAGATLMEWCGIPESKLPHKYIVNYYRKFFTLKECYKEYVGQTKVVTIFEQLARLGRVNHIIRWFIDNVEGDFDSHGYLEIKKEYFVRLLKICILLRNSFILQSHIEGNEKQNSVNIEIAQKYLPLMEGMPLSGYGIAYVNSVIELENILRNILATTDFEKETVYFDYGNYY